MDLDHFKAINDTFDHSAGNALLQGLGTFVPSRFVRKGDVILRPTGNYGDSTSEPMSRWAGDEFAITVDLSPGARRGVDEATGRQKPLEERMLDEVNFLGQVFAEFIATQPDEIKNLGLGISYGYALYDPEQPIPFEELFEKVDALMKQNKIGRREAALQALPLRKRVAFRLANTLMNYSGAQPGR